MAKVNGTAFDGTTFFPVEVYEKSEFELLI